MFSGKGKEIKLVTVTAWVLRADDAAPFAFSASSAVN